MTEEIRTDSATITTSKFRKKEKKKHCKLSYFRGSQSQFTVEFALFQPGERDKGFKPRNIGKTKSELFP